MIDRYDLEKFKGKHVCLGVPNDMDDTRLFFYFGLLINVNNEYCKIKTNIGYKIIPISQIRDIHLAGRGVR